MMDIEWTIANLTVNLFVGCGLFLVTGLLLERYFKWKEEKTPNKLNLGWEWVSNKHNGKGD